MFVPEPSAETTNGAIQPTSENSVVDATASSNPVINRQDHLEYEPDELASHSILLLDARGVVPPQLTVQRL